MKFVVLIGFLLTLTACYTVINHPRVTDPQNPQFSHSVYFTDDCSQCHADTREFNIPATARYRLPRVDYISENERWNYFYEFPWWYRPIFTGGGGGTVANSGNQPLPTISARRRFPGAGGSRSTPPSGSFTGGGYSPGGTIVGDTHKNSASTSPSSGSSMQRQKTPKPGRNAIRGSGNKKSSSHTSGKVQRRKKK